VWFFQFSPLKFRGGPFSGLRSCFSHTLFRMAYLGGPPPRESPPCDPCPLRLPSQFSHPPINVGTLCIECTYCAQPCPRFSLPAPNFLGFSPFRSFFAFFQRWVNFDNVVNPTNIRSKSLLSPPPVPLGTRFLPSSLFLPRWFFLFDRSPFLVFIPALVIVNPIPPPIW